LDFFIDFSGAEACTKMLFCSIGTVADATIRGEAENSN
jgi:hypothetical protein